MRGFDEGRVTVYKVGGQPTGLAATSDGTLIYCDMKTTSLGRIAPDGFRTEVGLESPAEYRFDVAVDAADRLWVTEWSNPTPQGEPARGFISRINLASGLYECASTIGYGSPHQVSIAPSGCPWFTVGRGVGTMTDAGELVIHERISSAWAGFTTNGLDASMAGTLWMTASGRDAGIMSYDLETDHWAHFPTPGRNPHRLLATSKGVWFTSFGERAIWRVLDGRLEEYGFDGMPYSIAKGPGESLFVSDFENDRVAEFEMSSCTLRREVQLGTKAGQPTELLVDGSRRLWVSLQAGYVASVELDEPVGPIPAAPAPPVIRSPISFGRAFAVGTTSEGGHRRVTLQPDPEPILVSYSSHPSFHEPSADLRIWRYLDFPKLVSLLSMGALHFARLDMQSDQFEGSLLPPITDRESLAQLAPAVDGDALIQHVVTMRQSLSLFRSRALISCWHINEHESAAMWDLYSRYDQGIAIRSSVSRLHNSLDRSEGRNRPNPTDFLPHYFMGIVQYLDYERDLVVPTTGLDYLTFKRRSFEHERELRLVLLPDEPVAGGQQVRCSLDHLIEAIYVAPTSPAWFVDAVRAVVTSFGGTYEVRQSDLGAEPLLS